MTILKLSLYRLKLELGLDLTLCRASKTRPSLPLKVSRYASKRACPRTLVR